MTVFVDHDANATAWWKKFSAYLDSQAQYEWTGTNPQLVPASKLTGTPVVSGSSGPSNVSVLVPTNAGQYVVELDRTADPDGGVGAWLIHDITVPSGTQ